MRNEKIKTRQMNPDAPGVHVLGKNSLDLFEYKVVAGENSGASFEALEAFYSYLTFTEPEAALSAFLKMFMHYVVEADGPATDDDKQELFLQAMLLNSLNLHSAAGTREELEELKAEFEAYRLEHEESE
nr:hypothetical protein [uncultured Pedobacter sp.]